MATLSLCEGMVGVVGVVWRQGGKERRFCSSTLREVLWGRERSHEVGCSIYHVSGQTTRTEGREDWSFAALLTAAPVSLLYHQI
jgi:hypothetical protein